MSALPFNVVVIDFPWQYSNKRTGGSMKSGASSKYSVMTIDDIGKFPRDYLNAVLAKDCIVASWATTPLDKEANLVTQSFELLGFEYKTKLYWLKERKKLGMGSYFRNEVEELRIYIRGNVKPFKLAMKNIIEEGGGVWAPVGGHSQKPEIFQDILEHVGMSAFNEETNFLECFARRQREGWTCLGSEIDGMDIRTSLATLANAITPSIRI